MPGMHQLPLPKSLFTPRNVSLDPRNVSLDPKNDLRNDPRSDPRNDLRNVSLNPRNDPRNVSLDSPTRPANPKTKGSDLTGLLQADTQRILEQSAANKMIPPSSIPLVTTPTFNPPTSPMAKPALTQESAEPPKPPRAWHLVMVDGNAMYTAYKDGCFWYDKQHEGHAYEKWIGYVKLTPDDAEAHKVEIDPPKPRTRKLPPYERARRAVLQRLERSRQRKELRHGANTTKPKTPSDSTMNAAVSPKSALKAITASSRGDVPGKAERMPSLSSDGEVGVGRSAENIKTVRSLSAQSTRPASSDDDATPASAGVEATSPPTPEDDDQAELQIDEEHDATSPRNPPGNHLVEPPEGLSKKESKEGSSKKEPSKQWPSKEEPSKEEPSKQGPSNEEPSKQGPSKEEPKEGPSKKEPSKQGLSKNLPSKEGLSTKEPSKDGSSAQTNNEQSPNPAEKRCSATSPSEAEVAKVAKIASSCDAPRTPAEAKMDQGGQRKMLHAE